jgi:hypothetical protein
VFSVDKNLYVKGKRFTSFYRSLPKLYQTAFSEVCETPSGLGIHPNISDVVTHYGQDTIGYESLKQVDDAIASTPPHSELRQVLTRFVDTHPHPGLATFLTLLLPSAVVAPGIWFAHKLRKLPKYGEDYPLP